MFQGKSVCVSVLLSVADIKAAVGPGPYSIQLGQMSSCLPQEGTWTPCTAPDLVLNMCLPLPAISSPPLMRSVFSTGLYSPSMSPIYCSLLSFCAVDIYIFTLTQPQHQHGINLSLSTLWLDPLGNDTVAVHRRYFTDQSAEIEPYC